MSEYRIQSETLEAIGDAIREKTGGSALINPEDMATEIASISGGVQLERGLIINSVDANGQPTSVTIVGDTLWSSAARINTVTDVSAPDAVVGQSDCLRDLTSSSLQNTITLPKLVELKGNGIYNCYFKNIYLPKFHSDESISTMSGQIYDTKLEHLELGSLENPVSMKMSSTFLRGNSQAFDVVIYTNKTTLAEAQAFFDTAPWSATNATITYKNSTTGEVLT